MVIALDYDRTYTEDPALWDAFIDSASVAGHRVICVTMRYPYEGADVERHLSHRVHEITYTSRARKRDYLESLGIAVQVWIDDKPELIVSEAA